MDCPRDSHDVCMCVWVCMCVYSRPYILGHVDSDVEFCGLVCRGCSAVVQPLFASLLKRTWRNIKQISLDCSDRWEPRNTFFTGARSTRKTPRWEIWVTCWTMALSCSHRSPLGRDIQVSLSLAFTSPSCMWPHQSQVWRCQKNAIQVQSSHYSPSITTYGIVTNPPSGLQQPKKLQ